jgi:hypothetical protein
MQLNVLSRNDFLKFFFEKTDSFMEKINGFEAFVVQKMYDRDEIKALRNSVFQKGLESEAGWHPLYDDCPDYHRLHDNYPQAYVKAKMHAFYHHGYYEANRALFDFFSDIFHMKNYLNHEEKDTYIKTIPSSGIVSRVNLQNYPKGGGYIAEHIDPVCKFAKIQTLIQASKYGEDFSSGGLYAKLNKDSEKIFLDQYTDIGDLILISPGIIHGVDVIDPEEEYNWKKNSGKWTILPIILNSDYHKGNKPQQTY